MVEHAIEVIEVKEVSILPTEAESAQQAIERQVTFVNAMNQLIDKTFKEGTHFATIPGTGKPTLMLPGIEMARGLLGVREEFRDIHTIREMNPDNPYFYYEVECILIHIHSGLEIGRGQAICHTREKSFMRQASRVCPNCGAEAIIKGKSEYGGGWLCWKNKGGCGTKFSDSDTSITEQATGMVNDPQLVWDGLNRARKIANKRAKADAIKNAAMLSEKFTVDLEDTQPITIGNVSAIDKWAQSGKSVSEFYAQCKRLPFPPQGKEQIFEALEVKTVSECTLPIVDAILTVSEHMAELAKLEVDAPGGDDKKKGEIIPIDNTYRREVEQVARGVDMKLIHKIEPDQRSSSKNPRYSAWCNYEDGDKTTPLRITLYEEHVKEIIAHCGLTDWKPKYTGTCYPAYEFKVPCGILTCWATGSSGAGYVKYFEIVLTDINPALKVTPATKPATSANDPDLWTRLGTDAELLTMYNHARHIINAANKYEGQPLRDGFDKVKQFLIDRKKPETELNTVSPDPMDIPF